MLIWLIFIECACLPDSEMLVLSITRDNVPVSYCHKNILFTNHSKTQQNIAKSIYYQHKFKQIWLGQVVLLVEVLWRSVICLRQLHSLCLLSFLGWWGSHRMFLCQWQRHKGGNANKLYSQRTWTWDTLTSAHMSLGKTSYLASPKATSKDI